MSEQLHSQAENTYGISASEMADGFWEHAGNASVVLKIGEEALAGTMLPAGEVSDTARQRLSVVAEQIIRRFAEVPESRIARQMRQNAMDTNGFVSKHLGEIAQADDVDMPMYEQWYVEALFDEGIDKDSIHTPDDSIGFAWNMLEQLAESERFSQNTDEYLMKLLDRTRRHATVLPSDDGQPQSTRDASLFLQAAESAYARDFTQAWQCLAQIAPGSHLRNVLEARLADAEQETNQDAQISEQKSTENLHVLTQGQEVRISGERLEKAHVGVTVGTTVATLEAMLDSPGGRYLSVHEHETYGGSDLHGQTGRSTGYNARRRRDEAALGHSYNVFVPRPIYGALTSDMQATRGSGYGDVELYPKQELVNRPETLFVYGDSLDPSIDRPARERRLNYRDAEVAYAHTIEHKQQGTATDFHTYIEVQLPGLNLADLEKVSLPRASRPGIDDDMGKLAEKLLERGVPVEFRYTWGENFDQSIKARLNKGMSKEEAYTDLVARLKGEYAAGHDVRVLFLVPNDEASQPDLELLGKAGGSARVPVVEM